MSAGRPAVVTAAVVIAAALAGGCAFAPAGSTRLLEDEAAAAATPATSAAGVLASSPRGDADGHERRGDEHLGNGDIERAFFEYQEALRLEPARVEVRYKAARLLLRRGLLREAEKEFRSVLQARPDSPRALLGLGHAAVLAGAPEAEQLLRQALALDPQHWQALNLLGLHYERSGNLSKAIGCYYRALAINPGEGSVTNNLGVALLRGDNAAQAVLAFRRAIEVGCRDPQVANNLGLALARLGRDAEALEAFRAAGSPAAAWNNLGYALLAAGKGADAVDALQRAVAAAPAHYERAQQNLARARSALVPAGPGAAPAPATVPRTGSGPR
jgi:Flp pilus assembly protein TadD